MMILQGVRRYKTIHWGMLRERPPKRGGIRRSRLRLIKQPLLEVIGCGQNLVRTLKFHGKITSQRLLDQSQAGVYMGENATYPPILAFLGPIRVPYPKGLNC